MHDQRGFAVRGIALVAILLVGIGGCLFSTRSPEPPTGVNSSFRDPTHPDTVLRNIRVAFNLKIPLNYSRCLADSFRFYPDAADAALVGEIVFENWGKPQEDRVFGTVLTTPGRILFTWPFIPGEIPDPDFPDDLYYEDIQYKVVFDSAGTDTVFSGVADLFMRRYATQWKMRMWVDKRDGTANATLGMVRANGKVWN